MATNIRVTDAAYNGKARKKPGPKPPTALTVAQHQAIQYMVLGDGKGRKMDDTEIARLCGVHRNTLREWRRKPLFEQAYKDAAVAISQDRLPEMLRSLTDAVIERGDAAAAKLLFRMYGLIGRRVNVIPTSPEQVTLSNEDIKIRLAMLDAASTYSSGDTRKGLRKMERLLAV